MNPASDPPSPQAELEQRSAIARGMGGPAKLARQRERGLLNARERLDLLFDAGSFTEVGLLAYSGPDPAAAAADGKIAGYGHIQGRMAAAVVNDFTVQGASSTQVNSRKIAHMKRVATERGMPLVFLGESSGGRIPETMGADGIGASGGDPQQYLRRRETPWASAILGPSFGSSAWYACLSDFRVMRRGAVMSVSSAPLVQQATGAAIDAQALGGWELHEQTTGLADQVVDTDEQALAAVKAFLSYLPSHAGEWPPVCPVPTGSGDDLGQVLARMPTERTRVYDIKPLIRAVVDPGSFFELKPAFGKSGVTALARLDGRSVGIIATNPLHKGGALEINACRKFTSFIVLCDSFNIPLIHLVDVPGFGIGLEAEQQAAPARIMNHMMALQMATVPKITVFLRKVYGQAYLNLGGGRNSDEVAAWPTAEVSFMAPGAAVTVVHGLQPGEPGYAQHLAELERETSAWAMAARLAVQHVIQPEQTRSFLIRMLEVHHDRQRGRLGAHALGNWPCFV